MRDWIAIGAGMRDESKLRWEFNFQSCGQLVDLLVKPTFGWAMNMNGKPFGLRTQETDHVLIELVRLRKVTHFIPHFSPNPVHDLMLRGAPAEGDPNPILFLQRNGRIISTI